MELVSQSQYLYLIVLQQVVLDFIANHALFDQFNYVYAGDANLANGDGHVGPVCVYANVNGGAMAVNQDECAYDDRPHGRANARAP